MSSSSLFDDDGPFVDSRGWCTFSGGRRDADRVRVAAHPRVPLETSRASRDVHRYRFLAKVKSRGVVYLLSNGDDHVASHADDVVCVSILVAETFSTTVRTGGGVAGNRRVRDETTNGIGGK